MVCIRISTCVYYRDSLIARKKKINCNQQITEAATEGVIEKVVLKIAEYSQENSYVFL